MSRSVSLYITVSVVSVLNLFIFVRLCPQHFRSTECVLAILCCNSVMISLSTVHWSGIRMQHAQAYYDMQQSKQELYCIDTRAAGECEFFDALNIQAL